MNAGPSLLAPNRLPGGDPDQVRVARDPCDIVEPPREIALDNATLFADDLPGHT
jgi:hypothetical protein